MTNEEINRFLASFGAEKVEELNTKERLKLVKELLFKLDIEIDFTDLLNTKNAIDSDEYVKEIRKLQCNRTTTIGCICQLKTEYKQEKKEKRKQLVKGIFHE